MKVSEVVYEYTKPIPINKNSIEPSQTSKIFYQSLKNNQIPLKKMLTKDNFNDNNTSTSELHSFLDIPQANQLSSISSISK